MEEEVGRDGRAWVSGERSGDFFPETLMLFKSSETQLVLAVCR